mmetsp:Transcript_25290/g.59193  ORF Transcript_25290/g.59193 Transcript_25290/m.59193 type:complete len:294 (+) Transcript_25290:399-1280(+)
MSFCRVICRSRSKVSLAACISAAVLFPLLRTPEETPVTPVVYVQSDATEIESMMLPLRYWAASDISSLSASSTEEEDSESLPLEFLRRHPSLLAISSSTASSEITVLMSLFLTSSDITSRFRFLRCRWAKSITSVIKSKAPTTDARTLPPFVLKPLADWLGVLLPSRALKFATSILVESSIDSSRIGVPGTSGDGTTVMSCSPSLSGFGFMTSFPPCLRWATVHEMEVPLSSVYIGLLAPPSGDGRSRREVTRSFISAAEICGSRISGVVWVVTESKSETPFPSDFSMTVAPE